MNITMGTVTTGLFGSTTIATFSGELLKEIEPLQKLGIVAILWVVIAVLCWCLYRLFNEYQKTNQINSDKLEKLIEKNQISMDNLSNTSENLINVIDKLSTHIKNCPTRTPKNNDPKEDI